MENKTILVDVDGVLADFVGPVLGKIQEVSGLVYTYSDVARDVRFLPGYSEDIENYVLSEGFCKSLPVISGSLQFVQDLQDCGFKIVYVTSPYYGSKTWSHERTSWLEDNFGANRDNIIFARNKKYVHGHALVDDKPENVIEWSKYWNRLSYLVEQPWNTYSNSLNVVKLSNINKACDIIYKNFKLEISSRDQLGREEIIGTALPYKNSV